MSGRTARHRRARASRRLRHAPLLVAVAAAVLLASVGMTAGAGAQTLPDPGWAITVAPASDLTDGQRVTANVQARADVTVLSVEIRQCRLGGSYVTEADVLPAAGNCPTLALSSSSNSVVSRGTAAGIIDRVRAPGGVNLEFKVGTGVATWSQPGGDFSLTCDDAHPCALVVQLRLTTGFVYHVEPLAFRSSDVIAACGGPADGVLATGSSDRLADAWATWTKEFCASTSGGAPTRATFSGEGVSVQQYAEGSLDVAYTGAGYNADVGLVAPGVVRRASVATPVALNATVIAVGGGYRPTPFEKERYPELRLTAAEVAAIFGGGVDWYTRDDLPYEPGMLGRNPALGSDVLHLGVSDPRPAAPSTAETTSWYATDYLATLAPDHWIQPGDPARARGASSSFVTADPPFPNVNTYSGRPALEKVSESAFVAFNTGPIWAITDLATARALDLTPVAIENAAGEFVAPTEASLLAAVATMTPDENGLLTADPAVVSAASATPGAQAGVTPYPLTFVEYALSPAEPLVDTPTCMARADSQAQLADWLEYVSGEGQQQLPDGLVALPADLRAAATDSIAQVGASPVTGQCAGVGSPPGVTPGGGSFAGGAAGNFAGIGAPGSNLAAAQRGLAGLAGNAATSAAAGTGSTATNLDAVAIPAFAGHSLPDSTGGIVALLGIVLVTSLAAWLTAGGRIGAAGAGGTGASMTLAAPSATPAGPRPSGLVLLWAGVVATGVGLVVYQLGPMLQQRDQHSLLAEYRRDVRESANQESGLAGVEEVTAAPEIGEAVGVLEIGALRTQAVAVEGVGSGQTQTGPGHMPGTAGLGQPGNSVVVARRNGYGGEFAELDSLRRGDRILVTTTQGQSVYRVKSVRSTTITGAEGDGDAAAEPVDLADDGATSGKSATGSIAADELFGPTDDDRLTLVTSASRAFWNTSDAVVVRAEMVGLAFEPTPQGARSDAQSGRGGDSTAWAAVVLVLLLYMGAIVGAVVLYRRMQFRVAYVLTVAPIVALTVIAGDTLSRLLPAWM